MNDTLRGAAVMTLAMGLFAIEDAFIKWVSGEVTVGFIILVIGVIGFVLFAAIARAQGHASVSYTHLTLPTILLV